MKFFRRITAIPLHHATMLENISEEMMNFLNARERKKPERCRSWLWCLPLILLTVAGCALTTTYRYADRIIVLDTAVMLRWGTLVAALTARGRALPAFDSLVAATALTHHMGLVTRNTQHFAETGILLINPWSLDG